MLNSQYQILSNDRKKGDIISEEDFITLIKICNKRNKKLCEKLINTYEFLEGEVLDRTILKK